jgi:inositol oxygenase
MSQRPQTDPSQNPLRDLDEWDDDVRRRYPLPRETSTGFTTVDPNKAQDEFRNYAADARPGVKEFYRLNHRHQTRDFVRAKKDDYLRKNRLRQGIWEAMEFLNTLVDDSDPDTDLTQIEHALQTAEQIRADGQPRWFILTGLIHDLGKILCLFGEPQWAVVGDTFPVGCKYSEKIVFHDFFADNPDSRISSYQTRLGVYGEGCGLDRVDLSWGHDEYIYHVVKDYLPLEGLYMLRYHSFYPAHREGEYGYLMNETDRKYFPWVQEFNRYDLYTKSHQRPDVLNLRPYYEDLIGEFFPPVLNW